MSSTPNRHQWKKVAAVATGVAGVYYAYKRWMQYRQELEDEIDALEERATDAAAEALGIEVEEGQSVEEAAQDALEDRLRDEAARQLERLLGGN